MPLAVEDRRRDLDILRGLAASHGQRVHERHHIKKLERRQERSHQQRFLRAGNILIVEYLEQDTEARCQHGWQAEIVAYTVDQIDHAVDHAQ